MYAVWGTDYDNILKEEYKCPVCPECDEPVDKIDGKYRCLSCRKEVEIDKKMKEWFEVWEKCS